MRRPRWKSIAKWVGLLFLAQVFGGLAGFAARPLDLGAVFSALILLVMIFIALQNQDHDKHAKLFKWKLLVGVLGGLVLFVGALQVIEPRRRTVSPAEQARAALVEKCRQLLPAVPVDCMGVR